jgi:glycine/D-amino acid oxidase-like deaminating enzyme
MTRLAKYSARSSTASSRRKPASPRAFKRVGSITVALTEERHEEMLRQAAMARASASRSSRDLAVAEVKARYPHLNIDGVVGGVYLPLDGQGDPANIALALAKGARQNAAR